MAIRDSAADSDFDELDRASAGVIERQVNLFVGRLAALPEAGPTPESGVVSQVHLAELRRCKTLAD
jgi:hypothetical protein